MGESAFVALGSNLGDRWAHLQTGLAELGELEGVALARASSVYETEPVGLVDQPPFLNAVVSLRTEADPHELLRGLQQIEARHRRQRQVRWGPRTLDLDLLLYGCRQVETAELVLPHPRLCERAFVLVPLCEIAAGLTHPVTGVALCGLLPGLPDRDRVRRLGPFRVA